MAITYTSSNPAIASVAGNVVTAGTVTITASQPGNGTFSPSTATQSLLVNPLPTATISASGATTFCAGGSVTLTASAGNTYLWSTGATTQGITVNASGSYSVRVTDANGCQSASSAATNVTVNPLPVANLTVSASNIYGPVTECEGNMVTLSTPSDPNYSYRWRNYNTYINGASGSTYSFNSGGGWFVVEVTNNLTSCFAQSNTLTVNRYNYSASISITNYCGYSTLTSMGSLVQSWSTGATSQSINVSTSGTYTVTGTSANGCTSVASVYVNVTPATGGSISASPSTNIWNAGYADLFAPPGSSWSWSTGATSQMITVYSAGTYSVTVTNGVCVSGFSINITNTQGANPCGRRGAPCYARTGGQEPANDPDGEPDVTELSVFPNPAKDALTIALPERLGEDKPVYLYDTFGKQHISSKIPQGKWKVSMELKGLPSGLYLVKVGYGDYGVVKKVMVVD